MWNTHNQLYQPNIVSSNGAYIACHVPIKILLENYGVYKLFIAFVYKNTNNEIKILKNNTRLD